MLRISAVLGVLVGLLLAYKTAMGMSLAYRYPVEGEAAYLAEHFTLQWAFVAASIVGGALALWLEWRSLLAAFWGIVIGLSAPHLIRPAVPSAMMKIMAAHGGAVGSVGADIGEVFIVVAAVVGLILCGASEYRRAPSN